MYKAGRQQEINFRFTRLPRSFQKKKKRKRKRKEKKLSCHIDAIRQGLHKIFPQVNKNLVDLFEYLPHVLANSRANNPSKSYINYFIEW